MKKNHSPATIGIKWSKEKTLLNRLTRQSSVDSTNPTESIQVQRVYSTFPWKSPQTKQTYEINYRVEGPEEGKPILLVHGFGANINHFRFQFPKFSQEGYRVYAIDLLGFGASPKPSNESYSIELWTELVTDFIKYISNSSNSNEKKSWILAGNSIGGLVSLNASKHLKSDVSGCVLYNCAGGMSIFRYDEIPLLLRPLLLFMQKVVLGPSFGGQYFENFRTRENVESILTTQGVYRDTTNVDAELLQILLEPGSDEGAKDVFLRVFAGEPGPTPESILPEVECPILGLWGESDPWLPVDKGSHPGDQYFRYNDNFKLVLVPGAGHCPHDESPEFCNKNMLDWMSALPEA